MTLKNDVKNSQLNYIVLLAPLTLLIVERECKCTNTQTSIVYFGLMLSLWKLMKEI